MATPNSRSMLERAFGQGHALTMINLQAKRPTLWEMEADLKKFSVPLLIIVGDEDELCIDGSIFLKPHGADRRLCWSIPRTGHNVPSEEPAKFNAALAELFADRRGGPLARAQATLRTGRERWISSSKARLR